MGQWDKYTMSGKIMILNLNHDETLFEGYMSNGIKDGFGIIQYKN